MKIRRSDAVYITTTEHKRTDIPKGEIKCNMWEEFIDSRKDYFIWYEDTEDGIYIKNNLDKIPDWAREKTIYTLNKKSVYIRKKIEKKKLSPCLDYWNGSRKILQQFLLKWLILSGESF